MLRCFAIQRMGWKEPKRAVDQRWKYIAGDRYSSFNGDARIDDAGQLLRSE